MRTIGIITEYNPFHKGHEYQIETLRKQENPDYIVVAMSGDFVQRGTPALMDKYTRTQMALSAGVDAVFELPVCYASSSAEYFARGGAALFHTCRAVDTLCFGGESNDLERITALSRILEEEPSEYRRELDRYLREGLSFPAARAKALHSDEFAEILSWPNNILALEYLKALRQIGSKISPLILQRKGIYHGESLDESGRESGYASATAIRKHILSEGPRKNGELLAQALPQTSLELMNSYPFLRKDDFSLPLHHRLLKENADHLERYADISPALANRILAFRDDFLSWSDFCEKIKTKNLTYGRISRALTHLLLDLKQESCEKYYALSELPYLRVLGFRKSAETLLKQIKENAPCPLLMNISRDQEALSVLGKEMLDLDLFATDLFRSVQTAKAGHCFPTEYRRKLLVV